MVDYPSYDLSLSISYSRSRSQRIYSHFDSSVRFWATRNSYAPTWLFGTDGTRKSIDCSLNCVRNFAQIWSYSFWSFIEMGHYDQNKLRTFTCPYSKSFTCHAPLRNTFDQIKCPSSLGECVLLWNNSI